MPKARAHFSLSPNSVSCLSLRPVRRTSVFMVYNLVSMFDPTLTVLVHVSMVLRKTAIAAMYKIVIYIYSDQKCSTLHAYGYAYRMLLFTLCDVSP